jgi:lauroyl/myristoyl acyltransferase/predicted metal-dependent phosphoesterase TrpH
MPVIDGLVHAVVISLSRLVRTIPWPILHLFASTVGLLAMPFRWRRIVLDNVRHVRAGDQPAAIVAFYLGMQQIAGHIKTVFGMLRAGSAHVDGDELIIEGAEYLEAHIGRRGIVIVAPHAGPYPLLGMLASRWLRTRAFGGEFAVVVRLFEPFRSKALMRWFTRCFHDAGVVILPADGQPRQLARRLLSVLSAHGIVALLIDEPTPTPSLTVPFFDSSIRLPVGPVRLARATGSVIIPSIATYGRGRKVTLRVGEPIEPSDSVEETLTRIARALEKLIAVHLDQWSMLTPIWAEPSLAPMAGQSYADLHVHTTGSDGLCEVQDWSEQAVASALRLIAITDHDHIATVRHWHESHHDRPDNVLPGVEITACGRIVHIGILFPRAVPAEIPRPGTPLLDVVRWARTIDGAIVVLVHPLPGLWRFQLRRLARAGLLPDAVETRFPLAYWRTPAIEDAARRYHLAMLGSTDAHLTPAQLGRFATEFPGESIDDLVQAIHERTTRAVKRPIECRPPLMVYALQCVYSWLLPFREQPAVARLRQRLLRRARMHVVQDNNTGTIKTRSDD